jgi:hypothetical protein
MPQMLARAVSSVVVQATLRGLKIAVVFLVPHSSTYENMALVSFPVVMFFIKTTYPMS